MAKRSYKTYTVSEAMELGSTRLREQYAKLSYVARTRLTNLMNKFPGYRDIPNYVNAMSEFAPLRSLRGLNDKAIAMRFSRLTKYLAQGTSTERGFRKSLKETVNRLHEHGYDFINIDNVIAFYRFMEDARQRGVENIYGSEQMVELFERSYRRKLTSDQIIANMDYWKQQDEKRLAEQQRTGKRIPVKPARFYASRGRKSDYGD